MDSRCCYGHMSLCIHSLYMSLRFLIKAYMGICHFGFWMREIHDFSYICHFIHVNRAKRPSTQPTIYVIVHEEIAHIPVAKFHFLVAEFHHYIIYDSVVFQMHESRAPWKDYREFRAGIRFGVWRPSDRDLPLERSKARRAIERMRKQARPLAPPTQ